MKYAKEITPKTQNAVYLILNARHLNITLSSSRVIVSQSLLLGANNQLTSCCIVSLSNQRVFVCVRAGAVFVHWCVWSRNLIINVINLDMIKKDDQDPYIGRANSTQSKLAIFRFRIILYRFVFVLFFSFHLSVCVFLVLLFLFCSNNNNKRA